MPHSDLSQATIPHDVVPHAVVIGQPIAHSRSPLLHGYWLHTLGLPGSYQRLEVSEAGLATFMRSIGQDGLVGCNVTVPHKQAVVKFLAHLDPAAEAIGAVNTVWLENGRLIGGNTDAHGFLASLDEGAPGWDRRGELAVLLGAGGAARAAIFALLGRGLRIAVVNRSLENANALVTHFGAEVSAHPWTELQHLLPKAHLLVQSTPLGMTGKPDLSIDISGLHQSATVYDMVYAPLETTLLHEARALGLVAVSGLGMLLHQAVPGFARWFGITPKVTPELRALLEADLS